MQHSMTRYNYDPEQPVTTKCLSTSPETAMFPRRHAWQVYYAHKSHQKYKIFEYFYRNGRFLTGYCISSPTVTNIQIQNETAFIAEDSFV